jgi:hypothetical protein
LRSAAIADRLSGSLYPAIDRGVRDDTSTPDGLYKIHFADYPVAVSNQKQEQIEHLRLDLDKLAAAAQLAPRHIKQMIAEPDPHDRSPDVSLQE